MLEGRITSKTRIKLLLKFFLNSNTFARLPGPENEFWESLNAIHPELNRFELAGLLRARTNDSPKIFPAGTGQPLYNHINQQTRNHTGILQRTEQGIKKPGKVKRANSIGTFNLRQENPDTDITPAGLQINTSCPGRQIKVAGSLIQTKRNGRRLEIRPSEQFIGALRHDSPLLWRFYN